MKARGGLPPARVGFIMARRLGTILVDMGYLNEDGLWQVVEEQKQSGNELIAKYMVHTRWNGWSVWKPSMTTIVPH